MAVYGPEHLLINSLDGHESWIIMRIGCWSSTHEQIRKYGKERSRKVVMVSIYGGGSESLLLQKKG
jgi:hypothetical protein